MKIKKSHTVAFSTATQKWQKANPQLVITVMVPLESATNVSPLNLQMEGGKPNHST